MWDLETQCCVQTIVGHRCEIWSLAVLPRLSTDGNSCTPIVITGAADELLRGYRLCSTGSSKSEEDSTEEGSQNILEHYGSLERQQAGAGGIDKCASLSFNAAGNLLAAQSSGKTVEVSLYLVHIEEVELLWLNF